MGEAGGDQRPGREAGARPQVNRGSIALAMLALTGIALALVAGQPSWSGPKLTGIYDTHGLHVGDLLVLAVWGVGAGYGAWLWRRR
jgi:hypothetical protein